ncbi:MAG: DNA cytosine methyltransferase [Bacilli bacterium]|nr:DNA cytosine methyltransferase [Bacilli bacterium]
MRILDYNPNFGTLSSGLEYFPKNEVVETIKLQKDAVFPYNSIHKQWFLPSAIKNFDYETDYNVDLAIFQPNFGGKVAKRSKSNFYFDDFQNCLNFLREFRPEFAIFQTELGAIELINTNNSYVRDGFNQLSKDRVIADLQKMQYKAYLVVIDEADYGIPLHRSFAFYVATPKDFDLRVPKPLFTHSGRGEYAKFRTVEDAIGDLGGLGEWVEYDCDAKNSYQRALRNSDGHVTWHFNHQNIKPSTKKKIASIKQGSNNETPIAKSRSKGYNRAKWDSVCRCMDEDFYLLSSKGGDSIHPIADRTFTIREGCRIHGLPDKLSFELSTSRRFIASMIHQSVAPAIGMMLGLSLGCEL